MSERTDDIYYLRETLYEINEKLGEIKQMMAEKNTRQVCKHAKYHHADSKGAVCLDCNTAFTFEQQKRDKQWNWQPPI